LRSATPAAEDSSATRQVKVALTSVNVKWNWSAVHNQIGKLLSYAEYSLELTTLSVLENLK
jgi:hypothetical protein